MISLRDLSPLLRSRARMGTAILAVVVSVGILALIAGVGDTRRLAGLLAATRWPWVAAAAGFIVLMHLVIALRLRLVLGARGPGQRLAALDLCFVHTLLLTVLPARLGDVCYPFMLNRALGVSGSDALLNLIVIRLHDFLIASLIVLLMFSGPATGTQAGRGMTAAVVAVLVIAAVSMVFLPGLLRFAAALFARFHWYRRRAWLAGFITALHDSYERLSGRQHVLILLATIVRWLLSAAMLACLLKAVGAEVGMAGALLLTGGVTLSVALPIQTVGGFGIVELAMVFFLVALGWATDTAADVALASRTLWVLATLGTIGLWLAGMRLLRRPGRG